MFEKVVATADGVFGNKPGDQPEKLRLALRRPEGINPRMACAHLSGFRCSGSPKGWPGYGYLVQAECGFLAVTGESDGAPARFACPWSSA